MKIRVIVSLIITVGLAVLAVMALVIVQDAITAHDMPGQQMRTEAVYLNK